MKILVLGHSAGQIGGVSNFLRMMEKKRSPDIDLVMLTVGPRDNESGKWKRLLRLFADYVAFLKHMLISYDVIHMNPSLDRRSFVRTLVFCFICSLFRKKYILFFRGWDWSAYQYFFESKAVAPKFVRWLLKDVSSFIVLAPSFREALEKVYTHTDIYVTTTMFNGEVMPPEKVRDYRSPRMLFMSRFIPAKGGIEAIDAFVEIKKKYPRAELSFAGDGPLKKDWVAHAKNYGEAAEGVNFIGYVREETKTAALAYANIFLMPTAHPEGMPNALMEAMGAGLIPVITEAGGTFDAIKFGELGYMLNSQDPSGIVDAVFKLMEDEAGAEQMSKAIRVHAWDTFESSVVINQILEVYRSVASK